MPYELIAEFPTTFDESRSPFRNLRFLVIDDNPEGRFLIAKTLLRRFPHARVTECESAHAALRALAESEASLIIAHHFAPCAGVSLLAELRRQSPTVPILMMAAREMRDAALAAGADAFLPYEEWLMVGLHAAALLMKNNRRTGVECPGRGEFR